MNTCINHNLMSIGSPSAQLSILVLMMRLIKTFEIFVCVLGLVQVFVEAAAGSKDGAYPDNISLDDDSPSERNSKIPAIFDFARYAQNFGKNYNVAELTKKSKLFIARTLRIFQHNLMYMKREVSYYLAQNEFTDLTSQELSDKYHIGQGIDFGPDNDEDIFAPIGEENSKSNMEDEMIASGKSVGNTILDFSSDNEKVENTHLIIDQLKASPKLTGIITDLVNLHKQAAPVDFLEDFEVKHLPLVASNNQRYSAHMIPSYGFLNNLMPPMENFANRPSEASYFQSDKQTMLHEEQFKNINIDEFRRVVGEAIVSGLLNSMKSIFDHLSYLDPPDDEDSQPPVFKNPVSETQFDIDWRRTGCISRSKSQGNCNSCYAFAVLGVMEYFYCRQTRVLTHFSNQYIVDCGSKTHLNGCKGGKIKNVGLFINKYGIELDAIYPYNGLEAQCPFGAQEDSSKMTGYLRPHITAWQVFNDVGELHKWLPRSPIIVGINMPADFLAYAGGVHSGLNCDTSKTHAMLLVASGKENGQEFWLFKNSYAETWGENGFFKLAKSAPHSCFNSAVVTRVKFTL